MSRLSDVAKGNRAAEVDSLPLRDEDVELMEGPDDVVVPAETIRLPFEMGTEGSAPVGKGRRLSEVELELAAPLDMNLTSSRKGGMGKTLTYLEWNTVAETLNRIFGFGRWSTDRVSDIVDLGREEESGVPEAVRCIVRIQVEFPDEGGNRYGHSATYTSTGFAEVRRAWDKDAKKYKPRTWQAYGMAVQSAERNAFKRAAANLGNQFGLSLYGSDDDEPHGGDDGESRTSTTTRASSSPSATAEKGADGHYHCQDCDKLITGYTARGSGKSYTEEDMVRFSRKDYGGVYCYDCKQNHEKVS